MDSIKDQRRMQSLPTQQEYEKLVIQWNTTTRPYPTDVCLHELFEAQVERSPDAIAISDEKTCITYAQLNVRANQLAHYLRLQGVGAEKIVGICMQRSIELIVGLLGILKAGGAYLPLDPSYPARRLAFLLAETQPCLVLIQQHLTDTLSPHVQHTLCLDSQQEYLEAMPHDNPDREITADNLAYLLYTSGSTGKPKGVMMVHRAVCNHLLWRQDVTPLNAQDRFLQKASSSFDISVLEIFWPLTSGARLILAPSGAQRDSAYLAKIIAQEHITVAHFGPAMLQVFLDEPEVARCHSLTRVFCGGEPLNTPLQNRFFERLTTCALYQQYGPTETCIDVTLWQCERQATFDAPPPIGKPIANVCIYILDIHMHPVPIGVPGEIYVGGACLARGYWRQPERTRERFIPNPFDSSGSSRLYRTGDQAYYLPDGTIEFIGRLDQQVKIRGFRIEPGEIEATLNQHQAIQQCCVLALSGTKEQAALVAYVVSTLPTDQIPHLLHAFLQDRLPEYMIPVAFIDLKQFPLNTHGKIDRSALPPPQPHHFASNDTTPAHTPLEEAIAIIWAYLLEIPRIGVHASFFRLGGNSLLATRMVSSLSLIFQTKIPLPYFYDHATVAELARFLLNHEIQPGHSTTIAQKIVYVHTMPLKEKERMLLNQQQQILVHLFPSENDNILLSQLLQQGRLITSPSAFIHAYPLQKHTQLSFGQQRLWNAEQFHEDSAIYNLAYMISLNGHLDVHALNESLQTIVRRHAVLHSCWREEQGQSVQVVLDTCTLPLTQIELGFLPLEQREQHLATLCEQEALQPFDLRTGPLLRASLLHVEDEIWRLLLTFHHAIFDGWSTRIFFKELQHCYQAYIAGCVPVLPPLSIQYSDYACWQREQFTAGAYKEHSAYWASQLQDAPQAIDLCPDYPRPAFLNTKGATIPVQFDIALTNQLSQLALDEHCSLFMLLLAVWFCLLHRYSGQQDLLVGTPIANRTTPQLESLIGFFVNTLVLRAHVHGSLRFHELLAQIRQVTLEAFEHQDLPLEYMLAQAHSSSQQPPPQIQTMFVLNGADFVPEFAELEVSIQRLHTHTAEFELTLDLRECPGGLVGTLEYNTELFSLERMQRLVGHFTTLLQGIVTEPTQHVRDLPLLTLTEREQILNQWNQTQVNYPPPYCIHQLFERQTARTPDAIALVFDEQCLSYDQLNQRANQLAHYLRKQGVGLDTPVGLFLPRSTTLMIALLGVLKAGAAYIPIDPSYPPERIAFMIKDTHISLLLTHTTSTAHLPRQQETQVICLDTITHSLEQEQSNNIAVAIDREQLAYILYTSGSTGQPKGVMVTHQALVNHTHAIATHYQLSDCDRVLQFASLSFDTAAEELFPAWSRGATVVMRPAELADTFALFLKFVSDNSLTILDLPTAYWHHLVEAMEEHTCQTVLPTSLRLLIIGGEQASATHLAHWFHHHNTHILLSNTYGPTETTITATLYDLPSHTAPDRSTSIPIGRPIANVQTYILDSYRQPVPVGVPGELYIGGAGLARGYWQHPELTQQRFVPNPFDSFATSRLYRTGDLVRYLHDGTIEFLGRVDQQVKIRGYRIELGEIEAVLNEHPAISQCVVVACSDRGTSAHIIAYVITTLQDDRRVSSLRFYLQERLPAYMIPAAFVGVQQFPINTHGKIDRALLPAPTLRDFSEERYTPPRNPLEEALAAIWSELLGVVEIGIHTSFFQLGGNSLLAIQLVSRLLRLFQQKLPLHYLFTHPTIAETAQFLSREEPQASRAFAVARALQKIRTMSSTEKHRLLEQREKA